MRRRRLTMMTVLIAMAIAIPAHVATAKPEKSESGKHDWLIKHPTIQKLLTYQNKERARYGMPPLKLDAKMCLAAQKHAVWMADTGYYTHSNLPWPEIIHHGPTTARGAVDGWIWSPAHYGIMLSSSTKVGLGYMVRGGRTYWVGVFE